MTPERLKQLLVRYTPTSERPIDPADMLEALGEVGRLQSKLQQTEDGEYVGHGDTVYTRDEKIYPQHSEWETEKQTVHICVNDFRADKRPLAGCYSTAASAKKGK